MSITAYVLEKADEKRFRKAAAALKNGEYTISLTHVDSAVVSAYVTNGDGETYGVSLTEYSANCSCKDAMYRGGICKHSIALAVRIEQDGVVIPEHQINLTLATMSPTWNTSMI